MNRFKQTLFGLCLVALGVSVAEAQFDFDDIRFWAGEGSNQAALVIDWSPSSGVGGSAAWGYRWQEGESPTGADLLTAVLEADTNLFAKLNNAGSPTLVYGLGYNAPGSDPFDLANDATQFDPLTGVAATQAPPGADPVEAIDRYQEGFERLTPGFWHYATADASPFVPASEGGGEFVSSQQGFATRVLTDGAWDAWTFDPSFFSIAFPDEPVAAPALGEEATLAGDYNRDGRVDTADYAVWRDSVGTRVDFLSQGADGDADGLITELDFLAWRERVGAASPDSQTVFAVPEPAGPATLLFLHLCCCTQSRRVL